MAEERIEKSSNAPMLRTREPMRGCARLGKSLTWLPAASVCRHLHWRTRAPSIARANRSSTTEPVAERDAHMCRTQAADSCRRDGQLLLSFWKGARQGRHSQRDWSWIPATLQRASSSCCYSALFLSTVFPRRAANTLVATRHERSALNLRFTRND